MWKSGKLEVGWGFAATVVLALLAGAGGVLPLVLLSALCHELGHLGALHLAGAEVERLRLTAFGAEIRADTRYLPYPKEILCTLAGPAVNLVLALGFSRGAGDYVLAGANLLLGAFNLLPIPPLDGSSIFAILLPAKYLPKYYQIQQYAFPIFMIAMVVVPYVFHFNPFSWYLGVTAGNLFDLMFPPFFS